MNQYVNVASSPFISISRETIENVIFEMRSLRRRNAKSCGFWDHNANSKKFLSGAISAALFSAWNTSIRCSLRINLKYRFFFFFLEEKQKFRARISRVKSNFLSTRRKTIPMWKWPCCPMVRNRFCPEVNLWVKENAIAYFSPGGGHNGPRFDG